MRKVIMVAAAAITKASASAVDLETFVEVTSERQRSAEFNT
jgi:hypothetical protein